MLKQLFELLETASQPILAPISIAFPRLGFFVAIYLEPLPTDLEIDFGKSPTLLFFCGTSDSHGLLHFLQLRNNNFRPEVVTSLMFNVRV